MSVSAFLLRNTVAEKPELCRRVRAYVSKKGLGSLGKGSQKREPFIPRLVARLTSLRTKTSLMPSLHFVFLRLDLEYS